MNTLYSIESILPGLIVTVGNLAWTILNIKVQSTFEKKMREEFCTRVECSAKHQLIDERHNDTVRRLDRYGI
jgi:hypothetical protein